MSQVTQNPQPQFHLIWPMFDQLFTTMFPELPDRLGEIARQMIDDEQVLRQRAESYLDPVIKGFKAAAQSYFPERVAVLKGRLAAKEEILKIERNFFVRQYNKMLTAMDKLTDPTLPLYFAIVYGILYLVLVGAGASVFSGAFTLVYPEQNLFTGIAMAIIIPCLSFLIASLLKRMGFFLRERAITIIQLIAISSGILMLIFFLMAKDHAAKIQMASTTFSLTPTISSFSQDIYAITSKLALGFSFIAEIGSAAVLAYLFASQREKHKLLEIKIELDDSQKRQDELEMELMTCQQMIRQSEQVDNVLDSFCEVKRQEALISFDKALDDVIAQADENFKKLSRSNKRKLFR